jgi:glycine hydroxymethyltransferase
MMAAKALAFKEANSDSFKAYAHKIVENSQQLAASLLEKGFHVLTGGTDNHIVLVNVEKLGLTGRQAESALRECSLTLNRNTVPLDINGPWYTSGLRFGTAAVTTLGMGKDEMKEIADIIESILRNIRPVTQEDGKISKAKYTIGSEIKEASTAKIKTLLDRFTLYPEIDLDFIAQCIY